MFFIEAFSRLGICLFRYVIFIYLFTTVLTLLLLTIHVSVKPYLLPTNNSFSSCLSESWAENANFGRKNLTFYFKLSKYQSQKEYIGYCLSLSQKEPSIPFPFNVAELSSFFLYGIIKILLVVDFFVVAELSLKCAWMVSMNHVWKCAID